MGRRSVVGDFPGTDELVALAQTDRLEAMGPITVNRSGRIGPLVELVRARRAAPAAFGKVTVQAPLAAALDDALDYGAISGLNWGDRLGVFPLANLSVDGNPTEDWTLWFSRADQAAQAAGFSSRNAAKVMGAFGELQDNVFRHSQAYTSALIAYAVTDFGFEFVVSDRGVGILGSLRTHPDYSALRDAGSALRVAITNGESRFGRDSGSGLGIGQIFRALANHDGDLRFRSDDYALEIRGYSPSLTGELELRHKAHLPGLTVSVLCRPLGRRAD